jgi:hypothetical protein
MFKSKEHTMSKKSIQRTHLALAVATALVMAPAAQAFEFEKGELTGSLDTTISYGYSWRIQEQDNNLIGKAYFNPLICAQNQLLSAPPAPSPTNPVPACSSGFPGSAAQIGAQGRFSVNRDDGNLKYDNGDTFSNAFKITSELSLKYRNFGAFTRATYFHDFENNDRADLTEIAKEKVGEDFRLLDAFVYYNFGGEGEEAGLSGSVRAGRQVVNWGESTFITNGINVINPVDLSKLRVAGSELKEAFQPIDMLWGSVNLTENLSLEALYMLEHEEIEVDPSGTYFSSNDFASPGGTYVMLGFGTSPQPVNNPERFAATCLPGGSVANSDRLQELTAFYAANPTQIPAAFAGNATNAALFAINVGCRSSVPRLANNNARDDGQYGLSLRWLAEGLNNTEFGFYYLNYHSRLPLLSGQTISTAALAPGAAPGLTAGYFVEFPEDLKLYGISWNTSLPGGVAWQGEYSYRPNAPLQVDDVELLFAALSPLNPFVPGVSADFCSQLNPGCTASSFSTYQRGWRQKKIHQIQSTFTKAFGNVIGAEQLALVGEIGGTFVSDLESQSVLRYEGEGTDTGGGCDVGDVLIGNTQPGCARNPNTQTNGFPTAFSWGYRLAARADYNAVLGSAFNLSPRVAFNHDVKGITPGPGGNFIEGRQSFTLGLEANYQNTWVVDVSMTRFLGAKDLNQIHDRDFASFTVRYSF